MTDCVLSVDIGTTSLKAGFISATGEVVAFSRQSIPFFEGRFVALRWMNSLKKAIRKMLRKCGASNVCIKAIVVSGNGPTIVSSSGRTLRWNENINYSLLGISKRQYESSLFLPRIMSFKTCFQSDYSKADFLFSGPEFLIYELCNAAVTILPEQRFAPAYWDKSCLGVCGIVSDKLPDFVAPGTICGNLYPHIAEKLNLQKNIPVVAGAPDFVVGLIGTNTLEAGKLCDRCGSSEGFNLCTDKPLVANDIRSLPSVIPGLWNASVLIPDSTSLDEDERLEECKNAVATLKKIAEDNKVTFPQKMIATGGQTKSEEYMCKKTVAIGMPISLCQTSDAELLGDACLGWVALGKYKSISEAAKLIVRETVTYGNL